MTSGALTRLVLSIAWLERLDLSENSILLTSALAVGAAAALGVVAFVAFLGIFYLMVFKPV